MVLATRTLWATQHGALHAANRPAQTRSASLLADGPLPRRTARPAAHLPRATFLFLRTTLRAAFLTVSSALFRPAILNLRSKVCGARRHACAGDELRGFADFPRSFAKIHLRDCNARCLLMMHVRKVHDASSGEQATRRNGVRPPIARNGSAATQQHGARRFAGESGAVPSGGAFHAVRDLVKVYPGSVMPAGRPSDHRPACSGCWDPTAPASPRSCASSPDCSSR
jgi:hypothetical protein